MTRTREEQETTFRWDEAERVLWAGTTTPWVARRWGQLKYPVVVLSMSNGTPCSWEVKLPMVGPKGRLTRLFSSAFHVGKRADTATSGIEPDLGKGQV